MRDGELEQLRPDKEHPLSQGEACPKGIAFTEVQNDPDRVLHPLRRRADGRVRARVVGDGAGGDRRAAARACRSETIGWYMGNPAAFSHGQPLWVKGFMDAIGSRQFYGSGSQDVNNRFAASALLYGSPLLVPIPDLVRTDFLLVVGANPFVSHGSVLTAPRIRTLMRDIVGRGGRVVVVDPRRSETARAFEHVPVRPDSDAWLLLSMLHVIFAEGLATPSPLARGRRRAGRAGRAVRAGGDRGADRRARRRRCARWRATSPARRAPPSTGGPARASGGSGRSSRSSSTR